MFAHNVPAYSATRKWRMLKVTLRVAALRSMTVFLSLLTGVSARPICWVLTSCIRPTFKAPFGLRGAEVVVVEEVCEDPHEQRHGHDLLDEGLQLLHRRHVDLTAPQHPRSEPVKYISHIQQICTYRLVHSGRTELAELFRTVQFVDPLWTRLNYSGFSVPNEAGLTPYTSQPSHVHQFSRISHPQLLFHCSCEKQHIEQELARQALRLSWSLATSERERERSRKGRGGDEETSTG